MRKLLSILLAASFVVIFAGGIRVKPYFRKDGRYVQPHYRSRPDSNTWNNYSTKGNINPYTGKKGYVKPYTTPKLKNFGYSRKSYKRSYGW